MYNIVPQKSYIKSLKKIKNSGKYRKEDFTLVKNIIDTLAQGKKINSKYKDHFLVGNMNGYRECHVRHDLLLVYKIEQDALILVLVDIGSHNQVFK